jgi:hypothetical protein
MDAARSIRTMFERAVRLTTRLIKVFANLKAVYLWKGMERCFISEFIAMLENYLHWYNKTKTKE